MENFMCDRKDNEPEALKIYISQKISDKDGIPMTLLIGAVMLGTKPPISSVIHLLQVSYNCC